jgi:hypothetical protein
MARLRRSQGNSGDPAGMRYGYWALERNKQASQRRQSRGRATASTKSPGAVETVGMMASHRWAVWHRLRIAGDCEVPRQSAH